MQCEIQNGTPQVPTCSAYTLFFIYKNNFIQVLRLKIPPKIRTIKEQIDAKIISYLRYIYSL